MKLYLETFVKEKKSIHFPNKRAHNLENLGGIHKKNTILLETSLLKNSGKLSSLSTKNLGGLFQKISNWKALICCQQRSIIRPCWYSNQSEIGSTELTKSHTGFSKDLDALGRNKSSVRFRFVWRNFWVKSNHSQEDTSLKENKRLPLSWRKGIQKVKGIESAGSVQKILVFSPKARIERF